MATTTPNYGWSVPTSSDLVKNGATDIETLGDSVDASLWNSGYGQAGKNKIINGAFSIWQRGTSFTITGTASTYTADRWLMVSTNNQTISQQTFTAGTAPVAGYEGTNFLRIARSASATADIFSQRIEDVRTFAGQPVTLSFWAKASAGTPTVGMNIGQNFGSGGSASVEQFTNIVLSTSWVRYTASFTLGSMASKTIGTSSYLYPFMSIPSAAGSISFDTWGWQVEYGSKATPFQTASSGSQEGELAMCQRYYYRVYPNTSGRYSSGQCTTTTTAGLWTPYAVTMRIAPTALEQSGTATDYRLQDSAGNGVTCSSVPVFQIATTTGASSVLTVASGIVAGNATIGFAANANSYLGWSAEL